MKSREIYHAVATKITQLVLCTSYKKERGKKLLTPATESLKQDRKVWVCQNEGPPAVLHFTLIPVPRTEKKTKGMFTDNKIQQRLVLPDYFSFLGEIF